jgi:chromosome-anchoring protein RacA
LPKETEHKSGRDELEERLDQFSRHIEILESKVQQKADEVLSYQVLQHRKELDNFSVKLTEMEERLLAMEEQLLLQVAASSEIRQEQFSNQKRKRNWFVSLLSMF